MQMTGDLSLSTYAEGAGNVLVMDDRQESIDLIQLVLEKEPVRFFAARSGQEALEQLKIRSYDLLLLDIIMPDISGLEICRIVKEHETWHSTKIIMISASNAIEDKLLAFDAGADDFVNKPLPVKELRARVRLMLKLRQAERELTHRNRQLEELIRISEHLNERLNFGDTATEIVNSATRLTKADRVYLLLWEPERQKHRIIAAENSSKPTIGKSLPAGIGLTDLVRRTGRMQIVANYQTFENSYSGFPDDNYQTAGLPLRLGDRHIGVLLVALTNPESRFSPSELDSLVMLANQAAIAIENARLYTDLAGESEKYRLIAEKASDVIISLDDSGCVTYVNERVQALLDYSPAEIIGQPLERFLAPEGQITLNQLLNDLRLFPADKPAPDADHPLHELLAVTKVGVLVNLEFSFGPLYQQGSIVSILGIGRDVTSRKRSEESERMRVIGQIAGGVAHDLNNMLANVLGYAQLLKAETQDSQVLQTIQIIEQSALDGAETVRRIQEFTAQRMPQTLDLLNLNTVIQSTIELNRPRWRDDAQKKGMQIQIERELQNVPLVRGSAAELREALINLFNNAIDAMPVAGGKIGFRTYLEKASNMVCLEVWDSGKGMTSDVRRRVFEPLFTTKGTGGTGLGLSVVRGIITRLGGEITVESSLGVGTTFLIKLPAIYETLQEAPRSRKPNRVIKAAPKYKGQILIVDDELNLRNILRRALTLAGFEVAAAASGSEALSLLSQAAANPLRQAYPFDLIFSDLGMPEMSGWDLAQEVHKIYPLVPLVLVTGWGDQLNKERMAELNVVHTIAKPFNIQDLITVAASLIGVRGNKN